MPKLPCLKADSGRVAYGEIVTSEDGDWSGVQFSFDVRTGRLRGWVVDARGGLPPEQRLDTLAVRAHGDSLYFAYYSDTRTKYTYWVRVTCQSLVGTARLFETATDSGEVHKVRLKRTRSLY